MALTVKQVETAVAEFCRVYPAAYAVEFLVRETQEDLYGPEASKEAVGTISGAFVPSRFDQEGRFCRGRCDIPAANLDSQEDLDRCLRHEILGHHGLNSFDPETKRSVLTSIVEARNEPGIAVLWAGVDRSYAHLASSYPPEEVELRKAEEVFATACERIQPNQWIGASAGSAAVEDVCLQKIRPMTSLDLMCITEVIAKGINDPSLKLQTFPEDVNAQFSFGKGSLPATKAENDFIARQFDEWSFAPEEQRNGLIAEAHSAALKERLVGGFRAAKGDASKLLDDVDEKDVVDGSAKGVKTQAKQSRLKKWLFDKGASDSAVHTVDVRRGGSELDRGDFVMPRGLLHKYEEVDGKFFFKNTKRVAFEDKGDKLATSTTDKAAIADMIAYAKAKQWASLKLAGSQDFRREAWLEAESRGIKTIGYTPKDRDFSVLEKLRQERTTNLITPLEERNKEQAPSAAAPRHDLAKDQASMHVEATKALTTNLLALQGKPQFADRSVIDLTRVAYWRGIVAEENRLQPENVRDEAVTRFDKQAEDPQFVQRIDGETRATVQDKTADRVQAHDVYEHSL